MLQSAVVELDFTMLAKAVVARVLLQCGKQNSVKSRLTLLHFSDVLKGTASKKVLDLGNNNNFGLFGFC